MSFKATVGTVIKEKDFEAFAQACSEFNLLFDPQKLQVKDNESYQVAEFRKAEGGYRLYVDTDARYSPMVKRIGKNCGPVLQRYSEIVIENTAQLNGGFIEERTTDADGNVYLTVNVGGSF